MLSEEQEKSCSPGLLDQDKSSQQSYSNDHQAKISSSSSENMRESKKNHNDAQFRISSPDKSNKILKTSSTAEQQSHNTPNPRNTKYQKIPDNMRSEILFRCMIMREPLRQTSKQLGINFSSAKNVIQVYKKEGRLSKKTSRLKRISSGELEDRMGDVNGDALKELKKKICPVKIEIPSINCDDLQAVRNEQIYVPLSGGRQSFECIKLTGIQKPQFIQSLNENDFELIFQQAERDLSNRKQIHSHQRSVLF